MDINEPIAVIGSACRFPGEADTPSKLWDILKSPRDLLRSVPQERYDADAFYHPDPMHHGTTNVRQSYFLDENVGSFDNGFFSIQPGEAEAIDPQQRILMETVYDSLCAAGQKIEDLRGSPTSVYVGLMCDDWSGVIAKDLDVFPQYGATGMARSIMANRISYFFDWHGPSMTIDTACSSSLVAVHQAIQSLRSGDSQVAVAAGANLILTPDMYIAESKLSMLSPTGRSRMWDKDVDGYARGEGIAAVVLKPLSLALRENDKIECLIRNTGVNQDGRTQGITMPSAAAQADLIRSTYAKAGLDLDDPACRPQFFHAHGTGTAAGDPQEAEAIWRAFYENRNVQDKLYVASIKTIIGHTEGAAGLASLIGTSLALHHGVIPPNMHFNTLNPRLAPFYNNLEVPTQAKPWPETFPGQPKRASINSFGFGGTNAHAILESYKPHVPSVVAGPVFSPLTFSASSEQSLRALLAEYSTYLSSHPKVSLHDLAYSLQQRTSTLAHRVAISAVSADDARPQIDAILQGERDSALGTKHLVKKNARILGVFTGQGSQWARMGARLLEESPFCAKRLDELQTILSNLSAEQRPSWTLREMIIAPEGASRVAEAAISQPICTAIQIILVDLLHAAAISFHSVVGHSSGEIGAAYAAGLVSDKDAIRIAYFRGLYAKLASSPNGKPGAMMAVGSTLEDVSQLCELEDFNGRIQIAAQNSPSSFTLSGDEDAIAEAIEVFREEGKFTRQLKVDTAYHSSHVIPCAVPYLAAMQQCTPEISEPTGTKWYSSVLQGEVMSSKKLSWKYWVDNMTQPVLFAPAVQHAWADGAFDLVLEVGPHPVLKTPCLDSIEETAGHRPPYSGVLARTKDDIQEFSNSLGLTAPPHPLLGKRCFDREGQHSVQWRNVLRQKELSWLHGHQIQGQIVFPATGYISMAVEAVAILAKDAKISLVSIENLQIGRAMAFKDDDASMEITFDLNIKAQSDDYIEAYFSCSSGSPHDHKTVLVLNASGVIRATLGAQAYDTLPKIEAQTHNMNDVTIDRFYTFLSSLGYHYSWPFCGTAKIQRKAGYATGIVEDASASEWEDELNVHPGMLDSALQTTFAAFSCPGDERMWALHVPTNFRSIVINPHYTPLGTGKQKQFDFISVAHDYSKGKVIMELNLLAQDSGHTAIQIEGMQLTPLMPALPENDAVLFSRFDYKMALPDGDAVAAKHEFKAEDLTTAMDSERISFYYLRHLVDTITAQEKADTLWHYRHLLDWAAFVVPQVLNGSNAHIPASAKHDTQADIDKLLQKHYHRTDVRLLESVGTNLPQCIRDKSNILEHMVKDGMLDDVYEEGFGLNLVNEYIADMAAQISHRYPRMNILEIGAGTGGSTRMVLPRLGSAFSTYTYTDVSSGFFGVAEERFRDYADRIIFKTYDMNNSPASQGFTEGSYDLVIASNVLHATLGLEEMMTYVRSFLKPGGFVIILETVNNDCLRVGLPMGTLSGWWLGAETGRRWGPTLTLPQWDSLLQKCGFDGIDSTTPPVHKILPGHVFCAQAVDERVSMLRSPLSDITTLPPTKASQLVIVGGETLNVHRLCRKLSSLLASRFDSVVRFNTVADLAAASLSESSTVLSLADLDTPVFSSFGPQIMDGLKALWRGSGNILWVTSGARSDNAFSYMSLGLGRCVRFEYPNINIQALDIDVINEGAGYIIAEHLLRLELLDKWSRELKPEELLWTMEPEVYIENTTAIIPRLYPYLDGNKRYNTARRVVKETRNFQKTRIMLTADDGTWHVEGASPLHLTPTVPFTTATRTLSVTNFLLSTVEIVQGCRLLLGVGVDVANGERLVFASHATESPISVPASWCHPCEGDAITALGLLSAQLFAESIIMYFGKDDTVIIHEAHPRIAGVLREKMQALAARPVFTTSTKHNCPADWIYIPKNLPHRLVRQCLPSDANKFVDLSQDSSTGNTLAANLPVTCQSIDTRFLWNTRTQVRPFVAEKEVSSVLATAFSSINNAGVVKHELANIATIPVQQLAAGMDTTAQFAIAECEDTAVEISIRAIDGGCIFRADRTYLLAGLTGELGQSLCKWMATHGAKYIALTSRKPKLSSAFQEEMQKMGMVVKCFAMDITDRDSVFNCHKGIVETMPPIIGVTNGAMILDDGLFDNMSFTSFDKVLKPKVCGSQLLDELFYDTPLDFFIFFSSTTAVMGNSGQSNYIAGNMFMNALASQRKLRGVAASSINISSVIGIGYVERAQDLNAETFTNMGYKPMSEQDVHFLFAEAILLGRPDVSGVCELSTGVTPIYADSQFKGQYLKDVKFGHFVMERSASGHQTSKTASASVRTQLASIKTVAEATSIIKESFLARLRRILAVGADEPINELVTLVEQGVDSLMAVEVRTWFLKELDLDIPVLKILGGSSVVDLLGDAISLLPPSVVDLTQLKDGIETAVGASPQQSASSSASPDSARTPESSTSGTPKMVADGTRTPLTPLNLSTSTASLASEKPSEAPGTAPTPESVPTLPDESSSIMSFGQSGFWFLNESLEDSTASNMAAMLRLNGPISSSRLQAALQIVAQRHEILRTRFYWDEEDDNRIPKQGVRGESLLELVTKEIASEREAVDELDSMRSVRWNLEDGFTMKLSLLSLSQSAHFMVVGAHHIILDGYSFSIFFKQLEAAYQQTSLPAISPSSQYSSFAVQQRRSSDNNEFENDLKYYRQHLPSTFPPIELLPLAKVKGRQPLKTYRQHMATVKINAAVTSKIRLLARKSRVTSFHFYLGALQALLFQMLPKSENIFIGIADANRLDKRYMESIGFFLNVLPLFFQRPKATATVSTMVQSARDAAYSVLGHSQLPFDVLLRHLNVPRSNTHTPLFQVFVDYRQVVQERATWANCTLLGEQWRNASTGYDIALEVTENVNTDTLISLSLQDTLYTKESADLLLRSYGEVIEFMADAATATFSAVPSWSRLDTETALAVGKASSIATEGWLTLSHQIQGSITKFGTRLALKDGNGHAMMYEDMGKRIDSICKALLQTGISQGAIVGVFQQPSCDWICSMLAILKVGAVYLPLDQRNSIPRLKSICKAAKPAVLITDDSMTSQAGELDASGATVLALSSVDYHQPEATATLAEPDSDAVILFTSGSTGEPKGIRLSHRNLLVSAQGSSRTFEHSKEDSFVVLQQSPFSFDLALDQIFAAVAHGGSLYVVPTEHRGDPTEITKAMLMEGVAYTVSTPSEYDMWLRYGFDNLQKCTKWTHAFSGGEFMKHSLARKFATLFLPQLRVFNGYGPAETTMFSTRGELDYASDSLPDPLPAGYMFPEYSVCIVDPNGRPVPLGVPGEIVIGGPGVAAGYLDMPAVTRDKFVADTYFGTAYKVYRSGDRGRLLPGGLLHCDGRLDGDSQVKLRGFRIELAEIEKVLMACASGALSHAVVTLRGEGEDKYLAAHLVFAARYAEGDRIKTLNSLKKSFPLPSYMRPSVFAILEDIPKTLHGKIDRKTIQTLPIDSHGSSSTSVSLTSAEATLSNLWRDILPVDPGNLEPFSDFFAVGGNSLLLVKLKHSIQQAFLAAPTLSTLMGATSLTDMATAIERSQPSDEIDWDRETAIPASLSNVTMSQRSHKNASLTVVLTGASGFLGRHLLSHLVRDAKVARIILLVRDIAHIQMVDGKNKVSIVEVDITLDQLGLSSDAYLAIVSNVDVVIHCAANRSFWDSYQDLQSINVQSVKSLTRLALLAGSSLHFISSGRVVLYGDDVLPPKDGSDGYVGTKWAAEKFLQKISTEKKLPVYVHRPVGVSRESKGGVDQDAVLQELTRIMGRIGSRPSFEGVAGSIDILPLDEVVSLVSKTALTSTESQDQPKGSMPLEVVYHSARLRVFVKELSLHVEADDDLRQLPSLPILDWFGKAKLAGFSYLMAAQELRMTSGGEELVSRR
ncbi:Acyl transferase/acyl hydrolase/lysophospholipase [Penicillium expansum]|nr:Acyl transferase/acyl hydrolase/lysophospholipase [Penicillium expansum]